MPKGIGLFDIGFRRSRFGPQRFRTCLAGGVGGGGGSNTTKNPLDQLEQARRSGFLIEARVTSIQFDPSKAFGLDFKGIKGKHLPQLANDLAPLAGIKVGDVVLADVNIVYFKKSVFEATIRGEKDEFLKDPFNAENLKSGKLKIFGLEDGKGNNKQIDLAIKNIKEPMMRESAERLQRILEKNDFKAAARFLDVEGWSPFGIAEVLRPFPQEQQKMILLEFAKINRNREESAKETAGKLRIDLSLQKPDEKAGKGLRFSTPEMLVKECLRRYKQGGLYALEFFFKNVETGIDFDAEVCAGALRELSKHLEPVEIFRLFDALEKKVPGFAEEVKDIIKKGASEPDEDTGLVGRPQRPEPQKASEDTLSSIPEYWITHIEEVKKFAEGEDFEGAANYLGRQELTPDDLVILLRTFEEKDQRSILAELAKVDFPNFLSKTRWIGTELGIIFNIRDKEKKTLHQVARTRAQISSAVQDTAKKINDLVSQKKYSEAAEVLKNRSPKYTADLLKDLGKDVQKALLAELSRTIGEERTQMVMSILGIDAFTAKEVLTEHSAAATPKAEDIGPPPAKGPGAAPEIEQKKQAVLKELESARLVIHFKLACDLIEKGAGDEEIFSKVFVDTGLGFFEGHVALLLEKIKEVYGGTKMIGIFQAFRKGSGYAAEEVLRVIAPELKKIIEQKDLPTKEPQTSSSPTGPQGSQEQVKLSDKQIEALRRIKTEIDKHVGASRKTISDLTALPWSKALFENFTSTEAAVILSVLRGRIKHADTIIATIINGLEGFSRYFAQETREKYYELVGQPRHKVRSEQAPAQKDSAVTTASAETVDLSPEAGKTLDFITSILKRNQVPKELLDEFEKLKQPLRDAIQYTIHPLVGERTRMGLFPTVVENAKKMMKVFRETGNTTDAIKEFCKETNWS